MKKTEILNQLVKDRNKSKNVMLKAFELAFQNNIKITPPRFIPRII